MNTRIRPIVASLIAVPLLALSLASCSSQKQEQAQSSGSPTVTAQDWGIAFAKCLRDAGHDIDDPTADGSRQSVRLAEGDTDEKLSADSATCESEVTKRLGERPVSTAPGQSDAEQSELNDCLRKEGIEVDDNRALNVGDIPQSVQEKCGVDFGSASQGAR